METEEEGILSYDQHGRPIMPPLAADVFMEVYSAVLADDILHFVTLADGSTDEDWGFNGICRLIGKHLGSNQAEMHTDFARAFFRDMHQQLSGEYTLRVDIDHWSDVVNICITRPGERAIHYSDRLDLFERGSEWRHLPVSEEEWQGYVPLPSDVIMSIHSVLIDKNVFHHIILRDGGTDEAWGLEGIESLLKKHLNDEYGVLHHHFAQHFFREVQAMMEGDYTIRIDVTKDSDIENIRITRPGRTHRYHHRVDLFESGGWWLN